VENKVNEINLEIIFIHSDKDLNVDHRIANHAVLTATRPFGSNIVKRMYAFEIPSSTEWFYLLRFAPNLFFNISDTIDIKLNALKKYINEMKLYPHPRSIEGVKLMAENWGIKVGYPFAKAFEVIRILD